MIRRVLSLFGTFALTRGDVPVTRFHSDKVRALLAYLVTESNRSHARATLAALLWPEKSEQAALRNLSQTLVRLRDVLGDSAPAPLHITWQAIQWQPDAAVVDVAEFAALLHTGEPDDLARAAELYRGEFLAGFSLPGCEGFEEWLLLVREQFQQQVLSALHTVAEYHLVEQHWLEAATAAQRQIELDRWREDAYRQQMRALAGGGDRAAALAVYQRCVQVLHDDLGIEPDGETVALSASIRSQEAPAAGTRPQTRPSLPSPLTPLVGRADELARVADLFAQRESRLVTLVGVGGVGKTRLALAAAWAQQEYSGVGWVSLAGITPAADTALQSDVLAAAVAVALGLSFGGRRVPLDELCHTLAERDLLLVLDNCEHLPVTAFVRELLHAAPRLRILATSRAPLDIAGETLLRLEGLPVPEADAEEPWHYAGVQLFLERAQRRMPERGHERDDLAAVVRLCRLLDGLPLGLELAARWVGHYSPDEIASEIVADLDFLARHGGDVPDRHRSMGAALGYSWAMLREPERQALARLSVFRGAFDRAAAQAVALTPTTMLVALVDASLLRHLGIGRYGFHELVRQFAAARLADRGEADALAERHANYYLDLLTRQETALYGNAPHMAAAVLRDVADNLWQAWSWALDNGAWESIARSLPSLRQYTNVDGLYFEHGARIAEAAKQIDAQIARGTATPAQLSLLSRLRGTEAAFLERQEERAAAAEAARAGIAAAVAAGDAIGEGYCYLQLSNATMPYIASLASRDAAPTIKWLNRVIRLCRATQHLEARERRFATEIEAASLLKLSTIKIDLREYSEACALSEQALALIQLSGNRLQEARALSFSAMALENAGYFQAAIERRMVMLELARANGSQLLEQVALNNLSCTLLYVGDYAVALEHARAALQISGDWMQSPYEQADFNHTLSWAACRAGETALALEAAQQALMFARATNFPQHQILPLLALGDALYEHGDIGAAYDAYSEMLTIARSYQTPQPTVVALAMQARCQLAQGQLSDALAAVDEALCNEVLTLGSLWEPLRIAEICYRVLLANGDPRAGEHLRRAVAHLEQQVEGMSDATRRRVFRECVVAHRALLAASN